MIQKKNGNSAFRRNLKLEPFFYLRIVHTLYMLIQYELQCFVEFLRYSEYSVNCISTNARNQPKENRRRASNVHVWGGAFFGCCVAFFRLISSRCSFVIRLFCDWFYAFCSTTLAYTVFKYGFNRLCCVWTFFLCKYTPDPTENKQQLICSLSLSLCVCVCICVHIAVCISYTVVTAAAAVSKKVQCQRHRWFAFFILFVHYIPFENSAHYRSKATNLLQQQQQRTNLTRIPHFTSSFFSHEILTGRDLAKNRNKKICTLNKAITKKNIDVLPKQNNEPNKKILWRSDFKNECTIFGTIYIYVYIE